MFYELQKRITIKLYKATDLHEFAKMCKYIYQTLRNVNNKFKNIQDIFTNDVECEEVVVIVNSN
jgi:hypothetical protein